MQDDMYVTENRGANGGRTGFFRRFGLIGGTLLLLFVLWVAWSWGFCRFYVAPGHMAIITAKTGKPMPPGQILAKPGEQGILEDVLGEGRHIWNPIFYDWEIAKAQYVPPGKIGIVTSQVGRELPKGEFLAEPGQKGIWRKVLGPGKYRYNPYGYEIKIVDAISIPVGFAGVVNSLSGGDGENSPEAAGLSDSGDDGDEKKKGVLPDILQPGIYFMNPREYAVSAVEVGVNQVSLVGQSGGVVLTKNVVMDDNNQMIQRLNQNILEEQKRRRTEYELSQQAEQFMDNMQSDPGASARRLSRKGLPVSQAPGAGMGRMPSMEKDVTPAYTLNQYVNFPSRDGFDISLDMTVEFELRPDRLAAIYSSVGDLPKVVDKNIMPQILSVSRNRGSGYRAVDFIAGEGREKFQNDLTDTLKAMLGEKNIVVHSALIRNVNVPAQILEPLKVTSLSRETNLTNIEKQNTAKKQAELNREMSLIKQFGEQVMQETAKIKAQIDAEMKKTVAMIQADTIRQMAAIEKETATVRASKTIALGKAEAESKRMVEEERAKGFGMKIQAFGRNGGDYALYEFAVRLNPDLRINLIHAGEGTLWTDLKGASLAEVGAGGALRGK